MSHCGAWGRRPHGAAGGRGGEGMHHTSSPAVDSPAAASQCRCEASTPDQRENGGGEETAAPHDLGAACRAVPGAASTRRAGDA